MQKFQSSCEIPEDIKYSRDVFTKGLDISFGFSRKINSYSDKILEAEVENEFLDTIFQLARKITSELLKYDITIKESKGN